MKKWGIWSCVILSLLYMYTISYVLNEIKTLGHFNEAPASSVIHAHAHIDRTTGNDTGIVEPGKITVEELTALQQNEQELTILTFNIRSANDQDGKVVLDSIIEEIIEVDAQLIGLQEVEKFMPRSDFVDQAKQIAQSLGYYYIYGSNINILGVQYGNALLSKYPISATKNHRLPRERMEPRGLLEAVVDADGIAYHVYVTHLGLNANERQKQMIFIQDIISEKAGNIILMGDFNSLPHSREMKLLDERLVDTAYIHGSDDAYTYAFHSEEPNVRIDRIYVSDHLKVEDHQVLPTKTSDHLRVTTKISHDLNY